VLLKERRHRLEDEVEVVVREVIEVHADLRPRLAPKKAVVAAQGVDGGGHESKRVGARGAPQVYHPDAAWHGRSAQGGYGLLHQRFQPALHTTLVSSTRAHVLQVSSRDSPHIEKNTRTTL
jgi:hypothetical protein